MLLCGGRGVLPEGLRKGKGVWQAALGMSGSSANAAPMGRTEALLCGGGQFQRCSAVGGTASASPGGRYSQHWAWWTVGVQRRWYLKCGTERATPVLTEGNHT